MKPSTDESLTIASKLSSHLINPHAAHTDLCYRQMHRNNRFMVQISRIEEAHQRTTISNNSKKNLKMLAIDQFQLRQFRSTRNFGIHKNTKYIFSIKSKKWRTFGYNEEY